MINISDAASFYKVGFQLLYGGNFDFVRELKEAGKQVFIDLKLLDIDNTVQKGVESLTRLGGDFLTIHAYPHAMRAAIAGVLVSEPGAGALVGGARVLIGCWSR